jgi:hypothetical protein
MRMHYSYQVSKLLRDLGDEGAELRRALESLKVNQTPDWAREITERPGRYEFPVAGKWIVYEVDRTGMETVISVTVIE